MVTIIGSVTSRTDNAPEAAERRHFTLESSVYETSKTAPAQFSVDCFFENTKRWLRVKTPPPDTFLNVIAKVAGRTATTNRLALRVLDLTYLPRPASAAAAPTPVTTPTSKRAGRWDGRAGPSTPSKRPRLSDPEVANPSRPMTDVAQDRRNTPSAPTSPSTVTCLDEGPLASSQPLSLGAEARPHRNRRLPGKYADGD